VRLAIGARRGRLVRQLITETAILFLASGAVALVLTRVLTRLLLAVLPALPVPVLVDVSVDWRVAIFGVGLSLAAAILSGLAPALQASRPDLVAALKTDTVGAGARQRLRHAFIVAQVAVSLALVIAGALLIRALGRAATIDPGFTQTGVDVVTFDLSLSGYGQADALAFASRAIARVRALPGVDAAAWVADLPLDDGRMGFGILKVPGRQGPDENGSFPADWNAVTPGVFRTLDLRLEHGRDFTDADTASAPRVIIVNEAMARSVWGTVDVIGRQFEDEQQHTLTIVGVADDARLVDLGRPSEPYVYVPLSQRYTSRVSLLVKSARGGMIPQVRTALRDLNPALPATTAMPLEQVTAVMFVPQRIAAAVAGTLGVFVLLLAAIGIYGVVAYSVGRRMREIGIRMALGADPEAIVRLLVRQSMVMTALGILVGLFAGAAAAQILRSLLFGIPPLDPIAFGGAASLFAIVSVAASYLPARRALRVDPMIALRSE